ncbi:hypothetical protein SO802_022938 [Lithocarpus litseifolius]|uniref:RNase H type-1 domain-containing protein n=1 Tax=Lithocarpus litseifolius TaxID=425828 RepID=A0AAW2C883_9ROSI
MVDMLQLMEYLMGRVESHDMEVVLVQAWLIWNQRNRVVHGALNRSGFGAVIRNEKGEVMAAMAAKGLEVSCSEEAEFLACRKAIEFAIDAGFSELVIEGDNSSVMKVVSAMQEDYSLLGNVIGDIHHLVRNLQWVRIECTRRGGNRVAHELAQFAKNISQDLFWMEDVPPIVRVALLQDANFSD